MRIIHLEDSVEKHIAIRRILERCGVKNEDIDWVKNVADGFVEIDNSISKGVSYDLVITDMHYPISKGASPDREAGEKLISWMQDKEIEIPIIVCSSINMRNKEIYGTVWYSNNNNWEDELVSLIKNLVIQKKG